MAQMKFTTETGTGNIDGKKVGKIAVIVIIVIALLVLLFNCFSIVN